MTQQSLYAAHIGITVLAAAAAGLLGFLLYVQSQMNQHKFTSRFLKLLAWMTAAKVFEILMATYRSSRMEPEAIPVDASVAALLGRMAELAVYAIMIWFMLKPETKRNLDGMPK